MPQLSCRRCSRVLEYSGDQPLFCAYCGHSLTSDASSGSETVAISSPSPTLPATSPGSIRGDETTDFSSHAGPPTGKPATIDRVGKYRLIRQLGRGGMGTVYEAEDSGHGRRVALKIIAPGLVVSATAVDRFRLEGRLASSLSHPRCVFVLEADEDLDGRPYIVMELMSGDTLQDLVDKGGPLGVEDAVAKINDVIEGLREAHRVGLIHRDVKPSNCFLEGDGRVKVGDFGLSKAQISTSSLTRTGSFLGTPLYASPEQIKVEPLDGRTDVYSTAATLFFLLTGRAPFDRGDAAATMARIVSDPAPSARERRPEIPSGLDRAIRKGLERDLDRRHADLDSFRAALRPFAPGQVPPAKPGFRIGAYLFDYALMSLALMALLYSVESGPVIIGTSYLLLLAYFTLGDGIGGGTPGKRLLRLRVADSGGREPAGVRRSAIRAAVFLLLASVPIDLFFAPRARGFGRPAWFSGSIMLEFAGLSVLAWPMRRGGDLRGLHDRLGGTRVVGVARDERRRSAEARRTIGKDRGSVSRPVGVMQAIGPYKVRGAVRWEPNRRVLAGEDSTLGREAWIVLRPKGSPAPELSRREVARATRPRWLAGGEQAEGRWDAYVAPTGSPLADMAGPEGLSWRDARPILEDLADELAAACKEGTLPSGLTIDQVWVQPDGRAILVDPLAIAETTDEPCGPAEEGRALDLLRKVAALALEGGRSRSDAPPTAIRAVTPWHASDLLARLIGGPDAHATVSAFRDDLEATRNLPTEATRPLRAMHLGLLGLSLSIGLVALFGVVYDLNIGAIDEEFPGFPAIEPTDLARLRLRTALIVGSMVPILWAGWDFATRGGYAARIAGLGLIRPDGREVPRWRYAWRTLAAWALPTALLIASVRSQGAGTTMSGTALVLYLAAGIAVALGAALAMAFPSKGPIDVVSGTRVVPR